MKNPYYKKMLIIISLMLAAFMFSTSTTFAYWAEDISGTSDLVTNAISIGQWEEEQELPTGTIVLEDPEQDIEIPEDTYVSFEGGLYIVTANSFNPSEQGEVGEADNNWAWLPLSLEWDPNAAYKLENTVVIYNGNYYILNHYANQKNPELNNGSRDGSGEPWTRIEPISDDRFDLLPGTNTPDYTSPDLNYVFAYEDWLSWINYSTGDIVIVNNVIYEAIADSRSKNPETQTQYWTEYTE